jgi:hypothetical protein
MKIKFIRALHHPHLVRSGDEDLRLDTPLGMAGFAGTGPRGQTCAACAYLDTTDTTMSDHGPAALCQKRQQMSLGRKVPVVPLDTAACGYFQKRPDDAAAVLEVVDRQLGARLDDRRAQLRRLEAGADRLREEISEIEAERSKQGRPHR